MLYHMAECFKQDFFKYYPFIFVETYYCNIYSLICHYKPTYLYMYAKEQHFHSAKHLCLCSTQESKSNLELPEVDYRMIKYKSIPSIMNYCINIQQTTKHNEITFNKRNLHL